MKSVFDQEAHSEIQARIGQLSASSQAQWGKMDVAQMLAHCSLPIDVQLGKVHMQEKGNFIIRLLFKKYLYNDRPYSHGLPTARNFVITDPKQFQSEQAKLLSAVEEAHARGLKGPWKPHLTFGKFSPEQVGMAMYKHLDHHLKQFGA